MVGIINVDNNDNANPTYGRGGTVSRGTRGTRGARGARGARGGRAPRGGRGGRVGTASNAVSMSALWNPPAPPVSSAAPVARVAHGTAVAAPVASVAAPVAAPVAHQAAHAAPARPAPARPRVRAVAPVAPVAPVAHQPANSAVAHPPVRAVPAYIAETEAELKISRQRSSLREKLIEGNLVPANTGMRAHKQRIAAEAAEKLRNEARTAGLEEGRAAGLEEIRSGRPGSLAAPMPQREVADKETAKGNLYLSESFALALKQDVEKWCSGAKRDGLLFAVTHLVGGEYDVDVFADLRDATKMALSHLFEHPELFAIQTENDQEGIVAVETLIRDVDATKVPRARTGSVASSSGELPIKNELDDIFEDDKYVFHGQANVVSPGLELEGRYSSALLVDICVQQKNIRKRRAEN
ncbi:hypothetical protein GGR57DRAFT_204345 [Xylariaceae sp. FL1272]|nr:hypothetical protein GGR57DRAFT_204345 [Xylariaceae sp. FL1272]